MPWPAHKSYASPITYPSTKIRDLLPPRGGFHKLIGQMRMLVENADDQRFADPSLLPNPGSRAPRPGALDPNPTLSVQDIAREEQVSAAYLYTLLRFPWLAPDITRAIINGRTPPQLTAQTLMRLTPRLPAGWAEQQKLLGCR